MHLADTFIQSDLQMRKMEANKFLRMAKDSAVRIELGRSFHQEGTFHLKVSESDFVPLWDGRIKRRSLAERKLLEGTQV